MLILIGFLLFNTNFIEKKQRHEVLPHSMSNPYYLREDAARFLHFCGTGKFGYQFYVLKSILIIILTILAINEVFGSQIGGSTEL